MADMASISSEYIDHTVSFVSPEFDWKAQRFYLNDHNEARPYPKTGLTEQDLQVLERYGVRF